MAGYLNNLSSDFRDIPLAISRANIHGGSFSDTFKPLHHMNIISGICCFCIIKCHIFVFARLNYIQIKLQI